MPFRNFAPGLAVPGRPLVLVCSTRAGNSLTAALAFANAQAGWTDNNGAPPAQPAPAGRAGRNGLARPARSARAAHPAHSAQAARSAGRARSAHSDHSASPGRSAQTSRAASDLADWPPPDLPVPSALTVQPVRPVMLHDYEILPCFDCGFCARPDAVHPPDNPARLCPLAVRDESAPLLQSLLRAPWLAVFAPIYFYHLPARLKALLDRCQLFYNAALQKRPFIESLRPRRAYVTLLAARERGDQLFSGSLLTLKYALAPLKLELQDPLLLGGLEKTEDLSGRPEMLERVKEYGRLAFKLEGGPGAGDSHEPL